MTSFAVPLLKGKTAIVTGGTTGIGRGIVLEYLRQGCNVVVNHLGLARDEEHTTSLLKAAQELRKVNAVAAVTGEMTEITGDVTKPEDCSAMVSHAVQRFGRLDTLVANAGIFKPAAFLEWVIACSDKPLLTLTLRMQPEILEQTLNVNISGTFYACQAAARQMVRQGHGGSIIGISSISALQGGRYQTHYTPTKAGILSLMQSMAIALGEHNIRCNALMPGTVRSQLSADEINNADSRAKLVAKIPLGRPGEPQDMAGPAVFLACDEMSSFMTGAGLLVDGGMHAYLQ